MGQLALAAGRVTSRRVRSALEMAHLFLARQSCETARNPWTGLHRYTLRHRSTWIARTRVSTINQVKFPNSTGGHEWPKQARGILVLPIDLFPNGTSFWYNPNLKCWQRCGLYRRPQLERRLTLAVVRAGPGRRDGTVQYTARGSIGAATSARPASANPKPYLFETFPAPLSPT